MNRSFSFSRLACKSYADDEVLEKAAVGTSTATPSSLSISTLDKSHKVESFFTAPPLGISAPPTDRRWASRHRRTIMTIATAWNSSDDGGSNSSASSISSHDNEDIQHTDDVNLDDVDVLAGVDSINSISSGGWSSAASSTSVLIDDESEEQPLQQRPKQSHPHSLDEHFSLCSTPEQVPKKTITQKSPEATETTALSFSSNILDGDDSVSNSSLAVQARNGAVAELVDVLQACQEALQSWRNEKQQNGAADDAKDQEIHDLRARVAALEDQVIQERSRTQRVWRERYYRTVRAWQQRSGVSMDAEQQRPLLSCWNSGGFDDEDVAMLDTKA